MQLPAVGSGQRSGNEVLFEEGRVVILVNPLEHYALYGFVGTDNAALDGEFRDAGDTVDLCDTLFERGTGRDGNPFERRVAVEICELDLGIEADDLGCNLAAETRNDGQCDDHYRNACGYGSGGDTDHYVVSVPAC